jgi:hypothetical protein
MHHQRQDEHQVYLVQIHRLVVRLVFRQCLDVVVHLVCDMEIANLLRCQIFRHHQDVVRCLVFVEDALQNLDELNLDEVLPYFHRVVHLVVAERQHLVVAEDVVLQKFQMDYFPDAIEVVEIAVVAVH